MRIYTPPVILSESEESICREKDSSPAAQNDTKHSLDICRVFTAVVYSAHRPKSCMTDNS